MLLIFDAIDLISTSNNSFSANITVMYMSRFRTVSVSEAGTP